MPTVFHIAHTPCAGAPGIISAMLDKYSTYSSSIYVGRKVMPMADFSIDFPNSVPASGLEMAIKNADILHIHNQDPAKWGMTRLRPFIIQLHTEPSRKRGILKSYPDKCITIAQKHAVLYGSSITAVPNMVPFEEPPYTYGKPRPANVVKIVYAPSSLSDPRQHRDTCAGKGYQKTAQILQRLRNDYGASVDIQILHKVAKEVVIDHKTTSDIVIDECVTGGYHLASLEGLVTGNVVIANLSDDVKKVISKVSGSPIDELPWVDADINTLQFILRDLINKKLNGNIEFNTLRMQGVGWMETYWHPKNLVKHYTDVYDRVLK